MRVSALCIQCQNENEVRNAGNRLLEVEIQPNLEADIESSHRKIGAERIRSIVRETVENKRILEQFNNGTYTDESRFLILQIVKEGDIMKLLHICFFYESDKSELYKKDYFFVYEAHVIAVEQDPNLDICKCERRFRVLLDNRP